MNRKRKSEIGRSRAGRRWLAAALCFAAVLAGAMFAGCSDSEANPGTLGDGEQNYQVELYYVNQEYVNEGDESLGHLMPEMDATITATPGAVYLETLKALSQVPDGDNYTTMLRDNIKVDGASLDEDGKTVTVDFMSQGLSGGSTEESLLVEQIVRTLTESFDQVERVRFTVGGAPADTLMGHLDTTVPYGIQEVDGGEGEDVEMVMPLYE